MFFTSKDRIIGNYFEIFKENTFEQFMVEFVLNPDKEYIIIITPEDHEVSSIFKLKFKKIEFKSIKIEKNEELLEFHFLSEPKKIEGNVFTQSNVLTVVVDHNLNVYL